MKTKIFFLFAVTLLISLYSCSKTETPPVNQEPPKNEEPDDPNKDDPNEEDPGLTGHCWIVANPPHYILATYKAETFKAQAYEEQMVEIDCPRPYDYSSYADEKDPEKYPQEAAIYTKFCKRYNDTSYTQERRFYEIYRGGFDYLTYNIVSINIESATDYDEAHPAGTSLNDLCILASASPREHIASGYTQTYDWATPVEHTDAYFEQLFNLDGEGFIPFVALIVGSIPFTKPLTECTPEDMVLMGNGSTTLCFLYFTAKPAAGNKLQRFIVTLTDERGKTYTASSNVCEW